MIAETTPQPTIEQEFGHRESRLSTLFHYHENRWRSYVEEVPRYIPRSHRENVAKRIANIRGLVVRDAVEKSRDRGLDTLHDIRSSVAYGKENFNGCNWMLAVAPEPLKGKLSLAESEFAITDGNESVYQNRVGECTGIILHNENGEIVSAHVVPIVFDMHREWENDDEKFRVSCELYLYQIKLVYPDINPIKIIFNSSSPYTYRRVLEQVFRNQFPAADFEAYDEPDIEYDPQTGEVFALTYESLEFSYEDKKYILNPVRKWQLNKR